jgi:AcrR family transcriptional regulator
MTVAYVCHIAQNRGMLEPARLRARKKQRTRDAIIQAAVRLFSKKGFEDTTVEEIAAAAEVAPRTFYRYFPTKEDVVFVDQDLEDEAGERELRDLRPGESDMNRVSRALRAILKVTSRNLDSLTEMYRLVEATPALQARTAELIWRSEKRLREGLLAGKARGPEAEFRARILAACVLAATRVVFMSWFESGGRSSATLWKDIDKALAVLRSGFDSRGGSNRS